jgi:serine/threonine protein kinase
MTNPIDRSERKQSIENSTYSLFFVIKKKSPPTSSRQKVDGQTVLTTASGTQYVPTKTKLGEGHFCKVKLVKKVGTDESLAVRKIKSQREFDQQKDAIERSSIIQATKHEVALYKKLQKKIDVKAPISKMVDCVEAFNSKNEKQLYQFFPLADLGNCESFYKSIPQDLDSAKLTMLYRHIANLIIIGMTELNKHNFFICDLKLENILVNSDSNVYVSDFGAATYFSHHHTIKTSELSDKRYQPPLKLITIFPSYKERASLHDQWALGLTLLEAWNNSSINDICQEFFILGDKYRQNLDKDTLLNAEDLRQEYKATLEKLRKLPEFSQMPLYLQKIIMPLLAVDTTNRKQTLEELMQPFKKELLLSQKEKDSVKNHFQTILQKMNALKTQIFEGPSSDNYNYMSTTQEVASPTLGLKK